MANLYKDVPVARHHPAPLQYRAKDLGFQDTARDWRPLPRRATAPTIDEHTEVFECEPADEAMSVPEPV